MQDEVDAAELWFCTMAPGITCDDLQDPAAEREHMVDDPNAESPGRRVEAKGSAAREGAQVRQRVEASLLEEMDMIGFGDESDEEERQRNGAMDEGENKSENEDDQDRDEDEQSRQRLAVAGEDDEDEEQQDDGSEGGVENNANTSAASGQKGHKRVSFSSKASSDMSLCGDSSSQGSAAENKKNSPADCLPAASTSEDHASPSGSCGNDGGDFDCGGGAEDGNEAQDAEQGGGEKTNLGSLVANNKVKSENCKKRKQGEGQYGTARCGKRRRFRVLEFWRNERVEYSRSSAAEGCDLPEIVEVILLSPEPTPFRPRKHVKKKHDKKWNVNIDDAIAAITWTDIEET